MEYNAEQRALIRRLGEVSAEFNAMAARHREAQAATAAGMMIDAVTSLIQAIDRANELGVLQQRYGDLWREFLDTL